MRRILFVADQFADVSRTPEAAHPGGAELTDEAAIEAAPAPVDCVRVDQLDPEMLDEYDLHIVGNLERARPDQIRRMCRLGRHILFEHDVRICRYRGNFPVAWEAYHRNAQRCICPHPFWKPLFESALGAIFLTHRQLDVYQRNPFFPQVPHRVLGSSLMNRDFFARVDRYRKDTRDDRSRFDIDVAIVYSRHKIKGYDQALEYCKEEGVEPYVIRDLSPDEVLDVLERTRRFVYLPIGLEPAGRMLLEARFLGCEVVTNPNAGVSGESWWHLPDDKALEVAREAPRRFWRLVDALVEEADRRARSRSGGPSVVAKYSPHVFTAAMSAAETITGARLLFWGADRRTKRRAESAEQVTEPGFDEEAGDE
ncbi:MAG: hypothetical protein ACOCV2_01115 [Persicimonas sp.]